MPLSLSLIVWSFTAIPVVVNIVILVLSMLIIPILMQLIISAIPILMGLGPLLSVVALIILNIFVWIKKMG